MKAAQRTRQRHLNAQHGAIALSLLLPLWMAVSSAPGSEVVPNPPRQGADLLKTDILGVFAHPDDETGMAATTAYYAQGRQAVIAHVYCTRGEGGGNMVGLQAGAALGILREAELRGCLTTLGVRYCYFLDRLDWAYTESVAATLDKWDKEETLERLVRLVRSLRPEVMVTMNPAPTPGQHGHHQAAGVLATEAFSVAADPKRFPSQLSDEGLSPWQPRKLFYSGGSTGRLATIVITNALPSGKTPAAVAAEALVHHRSQAFGNFGSSPRMQRPQRFTLVKSFVPEETDAEDLLRGLPTAHPPSQPIRFAALSAPSQLALDFVPRPALAHYREWTAAQDIAHVASRFQADLPLVAGDANEVRLRLVNATDADVVGDLSLSLPAGWRVQPTRLSLRVPARGNLQPSFRVIPPQAPPGDVEIHATWQLGHRTLESPATLHLVPQSRAVRFKEAPSLQGNDQGWADAAWLTIPPEAIFQGKVQDERDSSATFRLGHYREVLYVDVVVKDDVIVTNIAPNDIKGHWRSDSIEICIDPAAGAEHTMGCYKIGIFPFDTTGLVRAARDADARQGPIELTAPQTRLVSRRTADGYRIQVAIPFSELGFKKRHPASFGFNVIIYDGDKRDAALGENINKSRLAWAPRAGVMGRPEDWGRIHVD